MAEGEPCGRRDEHEALARLLAHNSEAIVHALRQPTGTTGAAMSALVSARTVADAVEEVTHVLVREARGAGHTWHEIGQLLGITRQAAQQRFGAATADPASAELASLANRSTEMIEQIRDADWDGLTADWDETMRAELPVEQVAATWERISGEAGGLKAVGPPSITRAGPYRIAEVPLVFEHGPMKARVTFKHDDAVAGLFVLLPDAA
jgi:hypothetical protein